ncbi:MAG TPA: aldo/keto reductase [Acidimicrobiales bacterium]|nr:aldo/keto reductase [Acidimicrobiales bacterium]
MEYRSVGRSGLVVSALGLGCNNFSARVDQAGATAIVDACFDAGVTFFDTADAYGDSEVLLGRALRGRRDDAVVATKFGLDLRGRLGPSWRARGSRSYVRRAVESSLRRLGTDHIDLFQQHVPDPATPLEETLSALDELVHEGKVRYVGCSNLPAWRLADAHWTAVRAGLTPFTCSQNRYHLLDRAVEADLVPACRHFGLGLIAYFPLANGLLTGKYRPGAPLPAGARLTDNAVPWRVHRPDRPAELSDDNLARVDRLQRFAADRGLSVLQLALGGLLARPGVSTAIAGATSPEQVRANADAAAWAAGDPAVHRQLWQLLDHLDDEDTAA